MNSIGHYYEIITKNYKKAIKYYLMAINKGNTYAMCNLDYYYDVAKEYDNAIKYYLMASDKGNKIAINNVKIMIKQNSVNVLFILLNKNNKSKFVQETILNICSCPKLKYICDQYKMHYLEECFICFNNEKFIIKTTCQHEMCYECFAKLYNNSCPFCRTNIE